MEGGRVKSKAKKQDVGQENEGKLEEARLQLACQLVAIWPKNPTPKQSPGDENGAS